VIAAALVLTLSGCPLVTTGHQATARFDVTNGNSGVVFLEGAVTFVTVDGDAAPIQVEDGDTRSIAAGHHVIHSYVRPCNGSCSQLGEPTNACQAEIDARAGREVIVAIDQAADRPCVITARLGAPVAS
jgi:hypothetical protein